MRELDEAKKVSEYAERITIPLTDPSELSGENSAFAAKNKIEIPAPSLVSPDDVMRLAQTEDRDTAVLLVYGTAPLKIPEDTLL